MKKCTEKIVLLSVILIGIISTVLFAVSIFQPNEFKMAITNVKQSIAGEQSYQMTISGKIITQNMEGKHIATVKLYKVNSRNVEQLVLSKNTQTDGTYQFEVSEIGNYKVIVEKEGYLTTKLKSIELNKGDNIVLKDVYLMPGDANSDGQIELDDIVCVIDNYGDISGESVPTEKKSLDFNGDGIVNQNDKIFTKESYTKITKDSLATVTAIENNVISVSIENKDTLYPQKNETLYYLVKTNKDVELVDSSKIYLVETGIPEDEMVEETDGRNEGKEYTLKSGERFVSNSMNMNGMGTDWALSLYTYEDSKNSKIVFAPGVFKDGDYYSELMEVEIDLIVDCTSPIVELNGDTNTTTFNDETELLIPLKLTEKVSGLKSFTKDNIEVLVNDMIVTPNSKTLTLNSSSKGINLYTLSIEGINATGELSLKIPANSVEDNVGNTMQETVLKPGIVVEDVLTPVTSVKEFVACVQTEGQPETAVNYETLTEAIAQCSEGKVIKLLTSFTEEVTIESEKNITLDLNGNSIGSSTNTTIINNGQLSVIDTVGGGSIQNRSQSSDYYAINNNGTLIINANITATRNGIKNNASLTIESGTILVDDTLSSSSCIINGTKSAVTNINGGIIKCCAQNKSAAIRVNYGLFNMTAGEINIQGSYVYGIYAYNEAYKEINILGGKILVNDGLESSNYYTNCYGIYISGYRSGQTYYSKLTIGVKDGNVNDESPYIASNQYCIHTRWANCSMYDGLLIGSSTSMQEVEDGYMFKQYQVFGQGSRAYLIRQDEVAYIQNGDSKTTFTSLQSAINSCPDNPEERTVINLTNTCNVCTCVQNESGEIEHTCGLIIPAGKKIKINCNYQTIDIGNEMINNGDLIIESSNITSSYDGKVVNNGSLVSNFVGINCRIKNYGNMELLGYAYTTIYDEGEEAISNYGNLIIDAEGEISSQESDAIKNYENSTFILGNSDEDINKYNMIINAQCGYAVVNEGRFEMYSGILQGDDQNIDAVQGEINQCRQNHNYIVFKSDCYVYGELIVEESAAYVETSDGKSFFYTLQEAMDFAIKNDGADNVYILNDIEENVKIKYNPLNTRRGMSIHFNGHTVTGTGTAIYCTASGEMTIYGPGKIVSTDGCAFENDTYTTIQDIELDGKTYGLINSTNTLYMYNCKVKGNIAIKNSNSINYSNNDGNVIEIEGIEKGIENSGYFSINGPSNIIGKIGIENNADCYFYMYNDNNIITGEEIGVENSGTFNCTGVKIIGKVALQGNDISFDSSYKIENTTENEMQVLKSLESNPPSVDMNAESGDKHNEEFKVKINIYDSGSGYKEGTFDINDLVITLGTTDLQPTVRRLEYVGTEGYTHKFELTLAYTITDESMSGNSIKITVPKDSFCDNNNNMNTEYFWNSYFEIIM